MTVSCRLPTLIGVTSVLAALVLLPVYGHASVLPAYPQAKLEEERSIESASHRVMLSPIREVGNEVRAEQSVRVPVSGSGQLYLVGSDASRQDARRWYLQKLQAMNATVLFQCEGRQCGRSNVWANQVFDQSTLYGRDINQDYLVAGLEDEAGKRWLVTLYTVTRGNQREYLWVEQLEVPQEAVVPGLSGAGSRLSGPVIVPWDGDISVRLDWSVETRRLLRDRTSDPGSRLVIAAFAELRPGETIEQSVERSQRAAQTMSDLLDRSGIPRSRHIIHGLGPLVRITAPGRPANRIELLIIAPPAGGSNDES